MNSELVYEYGLQLLDDELMVVLFDSVLCMMVKVTYPIIRNKMNGRGFGLPFYGIINGYSNAN